MLTVRVTFSLLLLLALVPVSLILPINCSEDSNGIIQGKVKGFQINKFENVSYAEISVFQDDDLIAKTLSNVSGEYVLKLTPGTYKIQASAEGFVENTVRLPRNIKRWINMLDPDDGVARYTRRYFKNIKIEDKEINTGWDPVGSHSSYWKDRDVARSIADSLIQWNI